MNDLPLVSIIIPTKNSASTLESCLGSVARQTYKLIEVIIVDAFSTDGTKEIAERFGANIVQLEGERAKAKNYGMQIASGKYILFLDADMQLTPDVVRQCVELCTNESCVITIPERSVGSGFWVKVRDFERSFYENSEVESPRFFNRSVVMNIGGFDEDIVFFEESTLSNKLRIVGKFENKRMDAPIWHIENGMNLFYWCRKKSKYARTMKIYEARYRKYAYNQTVIVNRMLLFLHGKNKYKLLKNPVLALALVLLKLSELIAVKIACRLHTK